jgi:hypothetical protein
MVCFELVDKQKRRLVIYIHMHIIITLFSFIGKVILCWAATTGLNMLKTSMALLRMSPSLPLSKSRLIHILS